MAIEDRLYPYLKYYQKLPPPIMNILGKMYRKIPLKIRYGDAFIRYYNLIQYSQYWNDYEKGEFIRNELKKTLSNAYTNTNYYKNLFDSIGIKSQDFGVLESFKNIPFSDKETIRKNKQDIINKNIPKSKLLFTTSGGTSGIPIEVYMIKGIERSRELAFMTRQWERVGYTLGDRLVVLRGNVVNNNGKTWYKYEPIKNRLILSNFDLNESNIHNFIMEINNFAPKFIHTYPSAITIISKYIIDNKISIVPIKAIFCSSEQFYSGQRDLIEKAFNTRIYSWYGHTESGTLAGECEFCKDYHIFFEYGYTELIDEKGNVIEEPNKVGEIVSTSFEMKAFPLIRYRTGDYAEYSPQKCKCGRNYKLLRNVKGRWIQEFIIGNDGTKFSLTALNMHTDLFKNVFQFQFNQKEKGKVILKIIPNSNYSKSDSVKILKEFDEKFRGKVKIIIEYVSNIPKTNVGKHKFLIQEIKEN